MDFSKVKAMTIPEGEVALLYIDGKTVWRKVAEQLTVPTISLDGSTLTMTATDDKTEEFVIFVDGVEMETVQVGEEDQPETPDTPDTPAEKYTLSGTWVFDETISIDNSIDLTENISYSSNGASYTTMYVHGNEDTIMYDNTMAHYYTDSEILGFIKGWQNQAYRTITFDGVQTVSKEFYEWFTANARQTITFTIDGTQYFADVGMTWGEWVESDYSKNEYEIFNIEYIRKIGDVGGYVVRYQTLPVFVTDAILANEVYESGDDHSGGSN